MTIGPNALEAEAHLVPDAPGVVVCHPHPGFGGRMDTPMVIALAGALDELGLSTVRFNFRGIGRSGGEPTGGLCEHEDVRAAAAWLRENGASPIALVGYSFGALMAARALADGEQAAALVAVGFPTTIIGDHPERLADVARAVDRAIPWLFLQGDRDQFCKLERIRSWARPSVRIDVIEGAGHFFAGAAERDVALRVAEFVAASLGR